jgi:hypothetical protein
VISREAREGQMAQYDVAHIDTSQYQALRHLVQEGRAKAVIVVDYLDASAPPVVDQRSLTMRVTVCKTDR